MFVVAAWTDLEIWRTTTPIKLVLILVMRWQSPSHPHKPMFKDKDWHSNIVLTPPMRKLPRSMQNWQCFRRPLHCRTLEVLKVGCIDPRKVCTKPVCLGHSAILYHVFLVFVTLVFLAVVDANFWVVLAPTFRPCELGCPLCNTIYFDIGSLV